jgi:hypothetical protein
VLPTNQTPLPANQTHPSCCPPIKHPPLPSLAVHMRV